MNNSPSGLPNQVKIVQKIDETVLPRNFNNELIKVSNVEEIKIRSNVHNMSEIDRWVAEFAQLTKTNWNFRKSKPFGSKFVCSKTYNCHHSSFQKVPANEDNKNARGISKNTNCRAQIIAKVKLTTKYTKFMDPFVKNGLPCIITIKTCHNHPLNSASALKCLKPSEGLRDVFINYFNMGMNVAQAVRYHKDQLILTKSEDEMVLENAQINPTKRTVQHWFTQWFKKTGGTCNGSKEERLKEAISSCTKEGILIEHQEEPFCLVVISPVMQRAHEVSLSKDMLFIESSSCCDGENYSITFLLCATPAGAIPNGVLVTKNQTTGSYINGFQLFQKSLPNSFYGQKYPNVIITDNCPATVTAVGEVWPESQHFFCIFHVLQNVLHWLQDKKHNIPKDKQEDFMSTFQTILYCINEVDAENAYYSALEIAKGFPVWQKYLINEWKHKEKWCLAYRVGFVNYHTNNLTDLSIRLFKENILNRIKAYNLVPLLEFFTLTLDTFYKDRLREFFDSRIGGKSQLYLKFISDKTNYLKKEDIHPDNDYCYAVPSEYSEHTYTVDSRSSFCDCVAGKRSQFCKHLGALYKLFEEKFNELPSATTEDRCSLAFIAMGKDAPSYNCFSPSQTSDMDETESHTLFVEDSNFALPSFNIAAESSNLVPMDSSISDEDAGAYPHSHPGEICAINDISEDEEMTESPEFDDLLWTLKQLHDKFHSSTTGIQKFVEGLNGITSNDQWETFLHSAAEDIPIHCKVDAKIKVEQTTFVKR